jgi:hypothetical protein
MSCVEYAGHDGSPDPSCLFVPTLGFRKLAQRIREEFEEFPHLHVTASEAARFWGLELAASRRVLAELRAAGVLAVDSNGRYRLRYVVAGL